MAHNGGFWRLERLSDAQLLEGLGGVLRAQRRSLAELVAHLGEVEDRRIHLEAACSSMFSYCVGRLAMSEDEACRRIEVARLARRFPALFAELESGQLTLSAALLLKPVLSADNHLELIRAARGKSCEQVRELVAERFPKPDAPSAIRKLPERRPPETPLPAAPTLSAPTSVPMPRASVSPATLPVPAPPQSTVASLALEPPAASFTNEGRAHASRIEPLAARRYKVQFTADADLKEKLERARDLLRHAHPSGDFAAIVSRALDLLLDDLLRRRFGAGSRGNASKRREAADSAATNVTRPATNARAAATNAGQPASPAAVAGAHSSPSTAPNPASAAPPPAGAAGPPSADSEAAARSAVAPSAAARSALEQFRASPPSARRPHLPLPTRRAVLERDGLSCSWVDVHGCRCGSRAWLELDHRQPLGKDGSPDDPDNVRLLCRSHNRLAAEHTYGRAHMQRASRRRRGAGWQAEPRG